MEFLRKYHFDFNRWIDEGVSWLSIDAYETVGPRVLQAFEDHAAKPVTAPEERKADLKPEDLEWLNSVYEKIDEWNSAQSVEGEETSKTFVIGSAIARHGFHRFLLYQELPTRYPDLLILRDKDSASGELLIKVSKISQKEFEADVERRRQVVIQELRAAFGFGFVMKAIIDAKKPVLGHNMFLDLALCFQHFIKPLPESSDVFCNDLHEYIPFIMDTKTIASKHPDLGGSKFETTALGELASILLQRFPEDQEMPKVLIPSEYARYKLATKLTKSENEENVDAPVDTAYHEAGYDALQTGVVFLNLAAFYCTGALPSDPITIENEKISESSDAKDTIVTPPAPIQVRRPIQHPLLPTNAPESSLMNQLNLMHMYGSFCLGQPHRMPNRRSMFLLSGLQKEDKTIHIVETFEPIGKFQISWVDSSSCVLTFDKIPHEVDERSILRAPKHTKGKKHLDWKVQKMSEFDAQKDSKNRSAKKFWTSQTTTGFLAGVGVSIAAVALVTAYMYRARTLLYRGD